MIYAKVKDGKVAEFPYGFAQLQADNPYSNYPNSDVAYWFPLTDAALKEGYVLVDVTVDDQPPFDAWTQNCVMASTPTFDGKTWSVGWVVSDKTPEELYAEAMALTCAPAQMRVELRARGRLDEANALVAQVGGDMEILWEYDLSYARSNPAWDQFGAMMVPPILPPEVTEIFRAAAARI